jgi:hypothetical protein
MAKKFETLSLSFQLKPKNLKNDVLKKSRLTDFFSTPKHFRPSADSEEPG